MANKYKTGDTVYIVSSVKWIKEAKVLKYADTGGGIKVRESRIFPTKEAAEASAIKQRL